MMPPHIRFMLTHLAVQTGLSPRKLIQLLQQARRQGRTYDQALDYIRSQAKINTKNRTK